MPHIQQLVSEQNHSAILQLESPEFDDYKVISAIHLNKWEEAIGFAKPNSYELAYIYYKLNRPKKALKILRKLASRAADVLSSQCLYRMQYYEDAYNVLKQHGSHDEYAVNLNAFYALNSLNSKNILKPSLFATRENGKIEDVVEYKYSILECKMEAEFNASFSKIEDELDYIEELRKLDNKFNIDNSIIRKQLCNLTNEGMGKLTKSESHVHQFNTIDGYKIPDPIHFQINFVSNNSEFAKFPCKGNFNIKHTRISPSSNKLRLLKCFMSITTSPKDKSKVLVKKISKHLIDSPEKQILELLISDCSDSEFQNTAMDLIFGMNE